MLLKANFNNSNISSDLDFFLKNKKFSGRMNIKKLFNTERIFWAVKN